MMRKNFLHLSPFLLVLLLCACEQQEILPASALLAEGNEYFRQGEYDSAKQRYAEVLIMEGTDSLSMARAANNLGSVLLRENDYDEALGYFDLATDYYQDMGDEEALRGTLVNLGIVYKQLNQLDTAAAYFYRAIPRLQEAGDARTLYSACNSLGNVERSRGLAEEAVYWHERALALTGDSFRRKALVYNNLGRDYQEQGQAERALAYFERSLAIKDSLGLTADVVSTLLNMSYVHREEKELSRALATINRALTADSLYNDRSDAPKLLLVKAELLLAMDAPEVASSLLAAVGREYNTLPLDVQRDFYASMELSFKEQEDWKQAYAAQQRQDELSDTLALLATHEDLNRQATVYKLQETEGRLLLQEAVLSNRTLQLYVALLLVTLVATLAFFFWRSRQRAQKEKQEKEEMLQVFQHMTKNQISALEGLLSVEMQRHKGAEGRLLEENRNRLAAVAAIHNRLGQDALRTGSIAADAYFEDLIYNTLLSYGMDRRVQVRTELAPLMLEIGQALWLGQLLVEGVMNACKHAFPVTEQPALKVWLRQDGSTLRMGLEDNGPGMEASGAYREGSEGMTLLAAMAEQVGAEWEWKNGPEGGCRHEWVIQG